MRDSARAKLHDIFRAVFDLPPAADVTTLVQGETPEWDSFRHVTLVTAIESEFNVSLGAADYLRMTSVEATASVLAEKGL